MTDGNLSSRKSPSEYHYETVKAQDIVQDYYRSHDLGDVADAMLPGYMLLMQSTWYKIYQYELNKDRRKKGIAMVEELWTKYIVCFKKLRTGKKKLSDLSTYFFDINRWIWLNLVGRLYFR